MTILSKKKIYTLTLLLFVLFFIRTSAGLPAFWTQEEQFSLGSARSTQPDVCVWKEDILVVWADNRIDGTYELFFRSSSDGGLTWSIEERITDTDTDSIQPAVAYGNSGVHLVWCEQNTTVISSTAMIFYSHWDGESWSTPLALSSTPQNSPRRPDIAITQTGVVYVAWEEDSSDSGTKAYFVYFSSDRGQAAATKSGAPIVVGGWNTAEPKIDAGYRTAYVVWRDEREATAQIYTKQLGETFLDYDIRLSSGGNCRRPSISVANNPQTLQEQIYVAYESRTSEFFPADIFVTKSNDGGQSWNHAHQITFSSAESIRPIISAAGDIAYVFWQDGESGSWKIYFSLVSYVPSEGEVNEEQTWISPEKFRDGTMTETLPAVLSQRNAPTINGSLQSEPQFYLFWVDVLSKDVSNIFYSRKDTIPPKTPGKPFHIDADTQVGYDNDDFLTFSWTTAQAPTPASDFTSPQTYQPQTLVWGVEGYNIYASIDGGDFEKVGSTARTIYNLPAENQHYYQILVEAFDSVSNTSELSLPSEIIYVDNIPPYVQIHLPRAESVLVHQVPIIVSCSDQNLSSCRLKYGATTSPTVWQDLGESINTEIDREKIAIWDISDLQGVYSLKLVAFDEAGNESFSQIPIIVDNQPPLQISSGEKTTLSLMTIQPPLDLESAYRTPTFSRNGNSICFSSNEGGTEDIWTYSLSTRQRFRVTQDQNIDFFPTWSPDSNWIAFQSLGNEQDEFSWNISIVRIAPDFSRSEGTDRRVLIQSEANETSPVFSPSGKQMAFVSDLDGDNEIYILTDVEGQISDHTRSLWRFFSPSFRRNSDLATKIKPREAFDRSTTVEGQLIQLTHNDYSDTSPTWSPDETRLCFSANRFGNWDVFEVDFDGSREKRLTDQFADETSPKYSPDGKRILYLSNSSGTYNSVMALDFLNLGDFGSLVPLTMPGEDVSFADWAPDMQSIVYQVKDSINFRKIDFPVEDLKAVITRPYEGENLATVATGSWADIMGIAKGANFDKYILEYSSDQISNVWKPISGYSTSQVEYEDFLGRLDTSNLQGEYIIRLTVTGKNHEGSETTDTVRVFVQSEYPNLSIETPLDGTITSVEMITVEGNANRFATLTVNSTKIAIEEDGHFVTKVLLNEGENTIQVRAASPTGLESYVERRIIRDTTKPELELTSPSDFVMREMPYVTVSGLVSEPAEVTLELGDASETTVSSETLTLPARFLALPLDDERKFSYTISLNEGTNEIRVKANDQAGFESEILRRVIYENPQKVGDDGATTLHDINPPAITNVFPLNGITLDTNILEIKASLVDDLEIDIDTLIFSFDGEQYIFDPKEKEYTEFDGEIFDFNSETGEFSYVPEFELADGEHNFTFDLMDAEENSAEHLKVTFFIDTRPISVALSASRDNEHLVISLASNKRLNRILEATVYPTTSPRLQSGGQASYLFSETGYSLNLNLTQEGSDDEAFRYTGTFYPVPTHEGFILSASVSPSYEIYRTQQSECEADGGFKTAGFYTEGEFFDENLFLSIPNGPSVSLERSGRSSYQIDKVWATIVLRSQDGFDLDRVADQFKDAENRDLKTVSADCHRSIVYSLESSKELDESIQIELKLPNLDGTPHKAMFYWNEELRNWVPLDATIDAQSGDFVTTLKHDPSIERSEPQMGLLSNAFGFYALLIDEQPPVIEKINPADGEDIPPDRFLVEVYFHDDGSGIAGATLMIDGKSIDFTLDRDEGRLIYFPKNLEPGLHKLSVSVYDRALNSTDRTSTFFSQEVFAFADQPICYPNPTSQTATISFGLTQSADKITLSIYDVAGEQVYKVQGNSQQSEFVWHCQNQSAEPIASGVYIYLLEAKRGEKELYHKGKIAVLR